MSMSALKPHPSSPPPKGPVTLVIMDGVGVGRGGPEDAVAAASTPTLDWLKTLPSWRTLRAHGTAVGMPTDNDMGNSEVGHNALGAGRIFEQGAALVNDAIESGRIFSSSTWRTCIETVKASRQALHFLGLLSDGNVHAHQRHLHAMMRRAADEGVQRIRVHVLLDGRDVPPRSARTYVTQLEVVLEELQVRGIDARVASGGGRMRVTMDRYEADWSMVELGWSTHVHGKGRGFSSLGEAVDTLYRESDATDQDLEPFVIVDEGEPVGTIKDGDAVILFNFRGDRAIEISRAFDEADFGAFERGRVPEVYFAGMMEYDGDLKVPKKYLVEPPSIDSTMSERLVATGKRQFAIAETQKFGHVTYFWNGNRSGYFDPSLERYEEIPSDDGGFETHPDMKAIPVTRRLLEAMSEGYDLLRVNFANGDMVGHTGNFEATCEAVACVDACLAQLVKRTRELDGVLIVTADHGNADRMFDVNAQGIRQVRSSHSLAPVPFVIFDPRYDNEGPTLREDLPDAGLAHVASTVLETLGLVAPATYAPSLIRAT